MASTTVSSVRTGGGGDVGAAVSAPSVAPAPGHTPLVRLSSLSKTYGEVAAVHPLDLEIACGDFVAILGPSGCGKTTLLRLIGGFVEPTTGTIEIAGRDVTRLGPERRPTNMVFQGYGLFPHMTVRQNIAYGLRLARRPGAEIRNRVDEMVALVHLEGFDDRAPASLSGGQAQRVALARALVMRPEVLLLDEPLAALDLKLRKAVQEELRRIHRSIGGTFVFVTHDQEEAMGLATRVAVMEAGRLVQQGTPEEIYADPRTTFVATFIGEANLLPGRCEGGIVTLDIGPRFARDEADGPVVVMVRPEAISITPAAAGAAEAGTPAVTGTLSDTVFLGALVNYTVTLGDGVQVKVETRDGTLRHRLQPGAMVALSWAVQDQRVLPNSR